MKRGNNMKKFGKLGLGAAVVSLFCFLVCKKLNYKVDKKYVLETAKKILEKMLKIVA